MRSAPLPERATAAVLRNIFVEREHAVAQAAIALHCRELLFERQSSFFFGIATGGMD